MMKKAIPWMLCAALALALIITNLPNRGVPNRKMPPDFAQFNEGVQWEKIYEHDDAAIWKTPAYGPKGCRHGESYAVTKSDRLLAVFVEGDLTPIIYQDGKPAAILPRNNRMREFYVPGSTGLEYRMFDIDGDGIVDFRTSKDQRWIYSHGEFVEVPVTNSPQGGTIFLLNGKQVRLKNGRWSEIDQEEKL